MAALIRDYQRTRFWDGLAPATKRSYQPCLDAIEKWAGDTQARAITTVAVEAFYQAHLRRMEGRGRGQRVIETPAMAAAILRVLRLLLGVGERLGYLPKGKNPATRPGISLRRQREPRLWSPAAVAQMVAAADRLGWRSIGTAILLNEWVGQREADLLALPPWQGGGIHLRQGKTGRQVILPVHLVPHLVERLAAESQRQVVVRLPPRAGDAPRRATLLRHERTGLEWNPHTFRHVLADMREAAAKGLPATADAPALDPMPECEGLIFMELRHTAVTRLHEGGWMTRESPPSPAMRRAACGRSWTSTTWCAPRAARRRRSGKG